MTQGLLSASVADAAPETLRGTAFGIFDLAIGAASFVASTAAGTIWLTVGSEWTFLSSAMIAALAISVLLSNRVSI